MMAADLVMLHAPLSAPPEIANTAADSSCSGASRGLVQPPSGCRVAESESRLVVEALGDEEAHHVLHVLAREGLDRQHLDKGPRLGYLPPRCTNGQPEEQPIEHHHHLAAHHSMLMLPVG